MAVETVESLSAEAMACQARGDKAGEEAALGRLLEKRPDLTVARFNLGVVLAARGAFDEAVTAYEQVARERPNLIAVHYNLGCCRLELGRPEQAVTTFEAAVRLAPGRGEIWNNLGIALQQCRRLEDACAVYRRAAELRPGHAGTWCNLGVALKEQGQTSAAIDAYREAVRLDPDSVEAHINLAHALLLSGRMEEGWREFEWRRRQAGFAPIASDRPEWSGEPLRGRTILLHAEQGLGDALQFVRFAPVVAGLGGVVILAVHRPLTRLLAACPGVTRVVAFGDPVPPHDLHCPLMSLPLVLGGLDAPAPYLFADPDLTRHWAARLGGGGRRIGLVWSGDPRPHDREAARVDRRRSMNAAHLAPLAALPGLRLISLQKGAPAARGADIPNLFDPMAEVQDFADTAAIIANLDLVIAVDTSVVHLAGGLGKPVWVLSRFDGCWRWLEARSDSPWYPAARIFRQTRPGDWNEVVERVVSALGRSEQSG